MTEREINDGGGALMRWFRSQDITPKDAIDMMLVTMANAILALADDKKHERILRKAIAKSLVGLELVDE